MRGDGRKLKTRGRAIVLDRGRRAGLRLRCGSAVRNDVGRATLLMAWPRRCYARPVVWRSTERWDQGHGAAKDIFDRRHSWRLLSYRSAIMPRRRAGRCRCSRSSARRTT